MSKKRINLMQCYHVRNFLFALLCLMLLISTKAFAVEDEDYSNDYKLDEITVTATKSGATKIQETPIAITAFDAEGLKARNTTNLRDITDYTPNTEVWGEGGAQLYYIRGIGNSDVGALTEPNVGIYVDGVYMERGYAARSDFSDVERVEVLRGPQGTLYGRNSTGGAINIITKAPTDEFEGMISLEMGSFDKKQADISISGPIVADKLSGRLSVTSSREEGIYNIVSGPTDQDITLDSVRGALHAIISDDINLIIRADYAEHNYGSLNGKIITDNGGVDYFFMVHNAYVDPLSPPDFDLLPGFYDIETNFPNNTETITDGLSATLTWQLSSNMRLTSITAYREIEISKHADREGTISTLWENISKGELNSLSQEFQIDGTIGPVSWITGLYYYQLKEEMRGQEWLAIYTNDENFKVENKAYAVFGNATYQITDSLAIGGGLRYSFEKKETSKYYNWSSTFGEYYYEFGGPNPEDQLKEDWSALTPKVAVEYKFTDDLMVYGSIASGFRSGGFVGSSEIEEQILDPEKTISGEIGIKSDWLNNRLRLNLTSFYSKYTDMQVQSMKMINGILTGIKENAADSVIYGTELEITARPLQAMTLNLSAGYLKGEFDSFPNASNPDFDTSNPESPANSQTVDLSGNILPFTSEFQINIGAQYVFDFGSYGFVTVRGDLSWKDDVFFNQYNDPLLSQEALTLVNGFIKYEPQNATWSLELYGKNLSDEKYYLDMSPIASDRFGDPSPPLTFGLRCIYNF